MARRPRSRLARAAFGLLLGTAFIGFCALGTWQVQRLQWKRALIERVDARIHAEPVAAPARGQWPAVTAASHEYRRVQVEGRWLGLPDARVQAVTELGPGWWLLSPLRSEAGDVVLVNRGFVPKGVDVASPPAGAAASVTGLLRMDEPGGGFLRDNDPANRRWYSRDVRAIAAAAGIAGSGRVAPWFIDAGASGDAGWPRGGMTVVSFRNSHLSYAVTWFAMALLVLVCAGVLYRHERRMRHHAEDDAPPRPAQD